jgi:LPXTG-motif cell wall-anchored protein
MAGIQGNDFSEPAFGVADPSPSGLTRREALRRGAFLGAGAVWTIPTVRTLTMSSTYAAVPSGGVEPEETPPPEDNGPPPPEVGGIQVTNPRTNQVQDQLPLTGIDAAQTAMIGSGMVAAGAALLRASRRQRQSAPPQPDQS